MYIKQLRIDAFGTLRDRTIDLAPGLNIIEGENESGKSATAMFIKFMFYGLSGKSTGGELTERRRYVNWNTGTAAGSLTLILGEKEYRVERLLTVALNDDGGRSHETVRESVRIIDIATNTAVHKGAVPGEALCGVPEDIFLNTVFVRQIDGARVNSTGILASIENLLFAGGESVSTKKALERLDEARRLILHKNGNGGLLSDLRTERSLALSALTSAEEETRTLQAAEVEFAQVKKQIDALRLEVKRQESICAFGEVNLLKRRFDTAAAAQKKLSEMEAALEKEEAAGINREYILSLTEADRRIRLSTETVERLTAAESQAFFRLQNATAEKEDTAEKIRTTEGEAARLTNKKRGFTAVAVTTLVLSLLAALLSGAFYYLAISPFYLPLIPAAVLLLCAAFAFAASGRQRKALQALLSSVGARDASGIAEALTERQTNAEDPERIRIEKGNLNAALSDAITQRRTAAMEAYELAARMDAEAAAQRDKADDDVELVDGALALLSRVIPVATDACARTETLRRETDAYSGRLALLTEQLSGENEAEIRTRFQRNMETAEGRIASSIDGPKLEEERRRLESMQHTLEDALEKMHRMETELAAKKAVTVSPDGIEDRIRFLDGKIAALTERHEAYCLAMETLKAASDTMRASVLPQVVTEACASVNRLSGGAFDAIGVGQDLSMTFTRDGQTREVEYLSEGTKDMAYLSLRRALTGVLFGGRRPPLIYDESFARMDEGRLARVLAMLCSSQEEGTQSILLTCRHLEASLAEAHVVKL